VKKNLTLPEAAELLGITERAAWCRLYRGQLPYARWGKKILIPVEELLKFQKSLLQVSAEEAAEKAEAAR
jgi:excisionase family DNA binding protein